MIVWFLIISIVVIAILSIKIKFDNMNFDTDEYNKSFTAFLLDWKIKRTSNIEVPEKVEFVCNIYESNFTRRSAILESTYPGGSVTDTFSNAYYRLAYVEYAKLMLKNSLESEDYLECAKWRDEILKNDKNGKD